MAYQMDIQRPVYIHQTNKLRTSKTGPLFEAMERHCIPLFAKYGLHVHGCWESSLGSGPAPEMLLLWEMESFDTYGRFLAAAHGERGDPAIREWFHRSEEWIESSEGMLCMAHPNHPTIAEMKKANIHAKMCIHETVECKPSRGLDYLDAIYKMWWPVARDGGRSLLGLLWSPWHNRRAINIWGWGSGDWGANDLAVLGKNKDYLNDERLQLWMTMGHALRDDWNDRFMVTAPFSPTR